MRREPIDEYRAATGCAAPETDHLVLGNSEHEGEQLFDFELTLRETRAMGLICIAQVLAEFEANDAESLLRLTIPGDSDKQTAQTARMNSRAARSSYPAFSLPKEFGRLPSF